MLRLNVRAAILTRLVAREEDHAASVFCEELKHALYPRFVLRRDVELRQRGAERLKCKVDSAEDAIGDYDQDLRTLSPEKRN